MELHRLFADGWQALIGSVSDDDDADDADANLEDDVWILYDHLPTANRSVNNNDSTHE
jgi:hypothetical protein